MKKMMVMLALLLPFYSNAQEIQGRVGVGLALADLPVAKKQALSSSVDFSYEFASHKALYFALRVEFGKLAYNLPDSTGKLAYLRNNLISVLPELRKYYLLSSKASVFLGVGPSLTFYYKNKSEIKQPDRKQTNTMNQINLGIAANVGYKLKLGQRGGIVTGLQLQNDIWALQKNKNNEIKVDKVAVYFSFIRRLGK